MPHATGHSFQPIDADETWTLLQQASTPKLRQIVLDTLVSQVRGPLEAEKEELTRENQKLQQTSKELQQTSKELQQTIKELHNKIQQLKDKNRDLKTQVHTLMEDYKRVQTVTGNVNQNLTEVLKKVAVDNYYKAAVHYRGSMTRAQAWIEATKQANTKINVESPAMAGGRITDTVLSRLKLLISKEEKLLDYSAVAVQLSSFFETQNNLGLGDTYVLDTHALRYLNDCAPDISIQRYTSTADRFNVAAVIDLKGADAKLGTASNYGQILDYIMQMLECQPGRRIFLGMLTDLQDAYIIKYTVGSTVPLGRKQPFPDGHLTQFKKAPLKVALQHLYQELSLETANPPRLQFSESAGELVRILQRHSQAIVAVYRHNGYNRIVKGPTDDQWASSIITEMRFLKRLQSLSQPPSIPTLVYADEGVPEFGITPVGQPICLDMFSMAEEVQYCLEDILSALAWVHKQGFVHRDVRTDNVIVYRESSGNSEHCDSAIPVTGCYRGLLIDFDRATEIGEDCLYQGGYICCPPEVLEQVHEHGETLVEFSKRFHKLPLDDATALGMDEEDYESPLSMLSYTPQKAHDYLAFVLLINTLIFPFVLQRYSYKRIQTLHSVEQERLLQLWKALRSSSAWSEMIKLAEAEESELDHWREYLKLIVWM